MPRFSIILPAFNSAGSLRQALDSLMPQLGDHELIVVDDASTDPGVARLLGEYDRIKALFLPENRGSSAARNAAIRAAAGERILFIDSDCVADKAWVRRHEAFHARYPDDAVIGFVRSTSLKSLLERFLEYGPSPMFGLANQPFTEYQLITFHFFFTCNASVPRKKLLESGLFDERYRSAWDDIELGYRLAAHGLDFRYDPKMVVGHKHPKTYARFFRRQVRVGKGYHRLHRQHPQLLGALTLHNQWLALKEGWRQGLRQGRNWGEKLHFPIVDTLGRVFFWYGYGLEKKASA